ncbi:PQQ-dependent sugar dehydrogenase [Brenneria sp. 4F2]|nr:PQQ-dependent sugar dehydrogenase [Brenneria bubanii]
MTHVASIAWDFNVIEAKIIPLSLPVDFSCRSRRHNALTYKAVGVDELRERWLDGNEIVAEERLLRERPERIREARVDLDGYLYVLTDHDNGKLLKIGLE